MCTTVLYMRIIRVVVCVTVFFISFLTAAQGQNQVIKGLVVEQGTNIPIDHASVYLKGTAEGTFTKTDGSFIFITRKLPDSLTISVVGFAKLTVKLDPKNLQNLQLQMHSSSTSLEEVVIAAERDPASSFMKKVFAHKAVNNPNKFKNYSYQSYNRSELDLNNFNKDKARKNSLPLVMQNIYNKIDTASENTEQVPIYFTETLTENYHSTSPAIDKEIIKATKSLGLETDKLLSKLDRFDFNINIYDDWLLIMHKTFASPLSSNGLTYYKYYFSDSTLDDRGKMTYKIYFVPKHKHDDTFTGTLWINDATFSITRFQMRMSKDANLNFVKGIKLKEEYALVAADSAYVYMPHKIISTVQFETGLELIGIPIPKKANAMDLSYTNTRVFDNIKVNVEIKDRIVHKSSVPHAAAYNSQKSDFWQNNRLDSLTRHEQAIYVMIDSLKGLKGFQQTTKIAAFAGTGFWDFGSKWRVGPYSSFISTDKIEGVRIRTSFWSLPGVSEKWNIFGYAAYGTKDQKLKGGLGIKYVHSMLPWSATSLSARSDYDVIIDYDDELDRDNILSSTLRKDIPSSRSYINEVKMLHVQQLGTNWVNKTSLTYKDYIPLRKRRLINNVFAHDLQVSEFNTNFRFSLDQPTAIVNYDRINLFTNHPVFEVSYTYAFKFLQSDFTYSKINIGMSQNLKLPPKSVFYYNLNTGRTFGTLPYILLNIPRGNEFFVASKYSFNTMKPYEFAADRYVSLQTRLSLGGLLLDKIPLIQKFGWRERFTFNSFWGDMTDDNTVYNKDNHIHTTGKKPFAETSAGIENIFHCLSLEYYWRLNHIDRFTKNANGLYLGLTLNF
jgi:hypothetical protein